MNTTADESKNHAIGIRSPSVEAPADASHDGSDAAGSTKTYAQNAVNATGRRISDAQSQLTAIQDAVQKAIHDDPVKAVAVTALVSSALTALFFSLLRNDNRYT